MNIIEDEPFDVFISIYRTDMMLAIGYESYCMVNLFKNIDSFEQYCWKTIPDRYENCGNYIP